MEWGVARVGLYPLLLRQLAAQWGPPTGGPSLAGRGGSCVDDVLAGVDDGDGGKDCTSFGFFLPARRLVGERRCAGCDVASLVRRTETTRRCPASTTISLVKP